MINNAEAPFVVLRAIFLGLYNLINDGLTALPPWLFIAIVVIAALFARGWIFALGSGLGLFLILAVNQWQNSMDTLALVLVAAFFAVIISIPLGILAARSRLASAIIRPILDFLQTMPAFVYLVPALLLFRVGVAPELWPPSSSRWPLGSA